MFIGRDRELQELERLYETKTFQMAIVYGRRRVGKTTLLSHFARGKRSVYFSAIETNSERNLELFSMALLDNMKGVLFTDWEKAFGAVADKCTDGKPLLLVIDEYPYLAQAERSISSRLQHYIDHVFKNLPLMLVLAGSSMSFMEEQVLGYQSPLYGRRTAQFRVMPFDYKDSGAFVPLYTVYDKALVFGVTGGIPKYLELFDDNISVKDNIIKNYLSLSGLLFEEPVNLLKQELREPALYNRIIEVIAQGASKLNEIATKCNIDTSSAANYIKSLIALGLLQRETPVTEEKNTKRTIYNIQDAMFRFWYRYIPENTLSITTGKSEALYDEELGPDLSQFMGSVFETMCAQYLVTLDLPFRISKLGRWWGSNPQEKREEEIDLVGVNERQSTAIFCECKYQEKLYDVSVLRSLEEKSLLLTQFRNRFYMLFSKNGFTDTLKGEASGRDDIYLVTLEDMYAGEIHLNASLI